MAAKDQPFKMSSGNFHQLKCEIRDDANTPVNLTGYTAKWAMASARQGNLLVEKSTADGITVPVQAGADIGVLYITLESEDTLHFDGTYYHELQVIDASGRPVTVLTGDVTIQDSLFN